MDNVDAVDVLNDKDELENPGGDQVFVKKLAVFLHPLDVKRQILL